MMGSEHHLHLILEDGEKIIVRVPTLSLTNEQRANLLPGEELYLTFSSVVMHFFDPSTTNNILVDDAKEAEEVEEVEEEASDINLEDNISEN